STSTLAAGRAGKRYHYFTHISLTQCKGKRGSGGSPRPSCYRATKARLRRGPFRARDLLDGERDHVPARAREGGLDEREQGQDFCVPRQVEPRAEGALQDGDHGRTPETATRRGFGPSFPGVSSATRPANSTVNTPVRIGYPEGAAEAPFESLTSGEEGSGRDCCGREGRENLSVARDERHP